MVQIYLFKSIPQNSISPKGILSHKLKISMVNVMWDSNRIFILLLEITHNHIYESSIPISSCDRNQDPENHRPF